MMQIDYLSITNKNIADILVVTATDIETAQLHKYLKPVCKDGILEIVYNDKSYYAGVLGNYNIIHCQCKAMGTQAKDASILTTTSAIQAWPDVKCVIMVGIAFGMYENEGTLPQHYSDVLVAKTIFPYERQRQNNDGSVIYKGEAINASSQLTDAFSVVSDKWERKNHFGHPTRVEICPILSGEKLVDDIKKRNILKTDFPEYRGGEMEGIGIASVCSQYDIPWILLKGICDFADGVKGRGKQDKQIDAAKAAVEACIMAFDTDSIKLLIKNRTNFYFHNDDIDINKIIFLQYSSECEPYYIIRNADEEMKQYILSKSSWVYGPAGMGKSELINRTLVYHNVEFIYVDMSLVSQDIDDVFTTILYVLCEKNSIEVPDVSGYKSIVNQISEILSNYYAGKKIYLFIDEIPFDFTSPIFTSFVERFCAMMNFFSRKLKNLSVFFMISSIASPIDTFTSIDKQDKFAQFIKFLKLENWTLEECTKLLSTISRSISLEWSKEISYEDFAREFKFSPRLIKNALKEIYSLGIRQINWDVINKIKNS